jgi:citrate lyase beta subunit
VRAKLEREPVEDYRIDFEDGYGVRPDEEEDGHAVSAANELLAGMKAGSLPWRTGIRVKSLGPAERERSIRTLRLFVSTLIGGAGAVPPNFIVNLPKVTSAAQVAEFARTLEAIEKEFAIDDHALRFEIMIESPQIVLGADGRSPLPLLIDAGGSRLVAAIFGGYDFTGALGITAAHQSLRHPVCELARNMMLIALGGSAIQLSDGATAVLPIGDAATVHAAWKVHYGNIRHAMAGGFYQGWDLHPAQLVSRYAATFAFFLDGRDAAAARLKNFLAKAEQATRVGSAFDDAATGHGLVNFFRLAVNCGAMTKEEVAAMIGTNAAVEPSGQ